ncbi:MAG: glycosyltransferase [Muribaculaceae bacterium]|nr:glycosyltransferase [Muribaculaceae bacterium]
MIALLRSTDGQPDSRFEKYTDFLASEGIPAITVCWDRLGVKTPSKDRLYYKRPARYGEGIRNLVGLAGFNLYIWRQLWRRRKDYKVIHAADFDTVLPALMAKLLLGKRVIYDIYDWYMDSRGIRNKLVRALFTGIEWFTVKGADTVIICEEGRRKQIVWKPRKLWILPNIPSLQTKRLPRRKPGDPIKVAYVGILSPERGLEELIALAEKVRDVHVTVGGFGPLEGDMADAARRLDNFTFLGRLPYSEALETMAGADMIYAMYHTSNPNHILAAPNKYYEGLALGRPIITTRDTLVGDRVEESATGYVIGEKKEDLVKLFSRFNEDEYIKICNNAVHIWDTRYSGYVARFMKEKYLPCILAASHDRRNADDKK